jgi:protoporphyrinogen oxidase
MYDFIIIGAGISGLYAAYQLKQKYPKIRLCILEKEHRIGGRMGSEKFHGVSIAMGAGVGREKDVLLKKLLKELDIPYSKHEYQCRDLNPHPVSVMETIRHLRSEYRKNPSEAIGKTFQQYATQKLGKTRYDSFLISAGYTDYEKEDVYETLYHYGMEDNEPGWNLLSISWNDLLKALLQKIGRNHIFTGQEVTELKTKEQTDDDLFHIVSQHGTQRREWKTANVILATTIQTIQHMLSNHHPFPTHLYNQIHCQPFLRIYAQASNTSIPVLKQYIPMTTLVSGPIHKIIPISPKKGIYMIVYTDNQGALDLKKYTENTAENRQTWSRKIEECFGLQKGAVEFMDIRSYYWSCGTHYYSPLEKTDEIKTRADFIRRTQSPMDNLWVVGEMISTKQGWVEGALESVQAVL